MQCSNDSISCLWLLNFWTLSIIECSKDTKEQYFDNRIFWKCFHFCIFHTPDNGQRLQVDSFYIILWYLYGDCRDTWFIVCCHRSIMVYDTQSCLLYTASFNILVLFKHDKGIHTDCCIPATLSVMQWCCKLFSWP